MRGDGDEICIGQIKLACRLRAIGKEDAALLPHNLANILQRLDHAGFIIRMLHCDQRAGSR